MGRWRKKVPNSRFASAHPARPTTSQNTRPHFEVCPWPGPADTKPRARSQPTQCKRPDVHNPSAARPPDDSSDEIIVIVDGPISPPGSRLSRWKRERLSLSDIADVSPKTYATLKDTISILNEWLFLTELDDKRSS